jgi:hypothetical protein
MKFSMTGRKMWPFNTGGCLIEVTAWTGLHVPVAFIQTMYNTRTKNTDNITYIQR